MVIIRPTYLAILMLYMALLACANVLPPLPDSTGENAPSAPASAPSDIPADSAGIPPFVLTVEVATSLTVRTGPGESFPVVSPINGLQPYFEHGESLWVVPDGESVCVADENGNMWVHVGSDRGIIGWAAGYYDGEFLLYPLPADCGL